jgi:quaternary ammonium compound-resistance protein SugE
MIAWAALLGAGLLEIVWAAGLKQVIWARPLTLAWLLGPLAGSMALLIFAVRTIPIGTAYAIWTGIGVLGAAVIGMAFYAEPANWQRLVCIGLILAGVIGLRVFS